MYTSSFTDHCQFVNVPVIVHVFGLLDFMLIHILLFAVKLNEIQKLYLVLLVLKTYFHCQA